MKRLLLENDDHFDLDRIHTYLEDMGHKNVETFFDKKISDATFNSAEAWEAVREADEIYAETSLIDFFGINGGTLFNGLMYKAIEEKVEGKSIYFFTDYKSVWWSNLNKKLVDQALRKNYLYVMKDEGGGWEQVDIDKLIKEELYAD